MEDLESRVRASIGILTLGESKMIDLVGTGTPSEILMQWHFIDSLINNLWNTVYESSIITGTGRVKLQGSFLRKSHSSKGVSEAQIREILNCVGL